MALQMFDFDGHVIRKVGVTFVYFIDYSHGVARPVKKVGISVRDVASTHIHLLLNVRKNCVNAYYKKPASIGRYYGAVVTKMLTSSARFTVARYGDFGIRAYKV
jgi:hypothetical protein